MLLIRDSTLLAIAMVVGRGSFVICGILVANFFGATAFALFTFVHLTATSVSNIAMLGLMKGLVRYVARMRVDPSVAALSNAVLSVAVVAFGLSVAVLVMALIPASMIGLPDAELKPILLALIFTVGLNNLLINVVNGIEDYLRIATGTFAMGLVLIAGIFLAFWLDAPRLPLLGYFVATLISSAILSVLPLRLFGQRLANQSPIVDRSSFLELGGYIGPMFIVTIMTNTGLWLAGRSLLSGGEAGLQYFAEFSVGMQWFGLAQIASNVACGVLMPVFTRNAYGNDLAGQKAALVIGYVLAITGAMATLLVVTLFHQFILGLYGEELSDAKWPLFLMVLAGVVAAPVSVLGNLLIAREKYIDYLLSAGIWWMIIVIGVVFFPVNDAFDITGLVLASYVAFMLASLWFVVLELGRMK